MLALADGVVLIGETDVQSESPPILMPAILVAAFDGKTLLTGGDDGARRRRRLRQS